MPQLTENKQNEPVLIENFEPTHCARKSAQEVETRTRVSSLDTQQREHCAGESVQKVEVRERRHCAPRPPQGKQTIHRDAHGSEHTAAGLALQTDGVESTLSGRARSEIGNRGLSFSRGEANTGVNSSGKIKRVARILPLLSILGLTSCFGSALTNLLVTSVKLTPANPSIAATETQAFMLSVTFVDGTTDHENPNDTSWTSDNTAVATIAKTGIATGVAPGTANIGGSFQGNNAHTVLTVTNLTKAAIAAAGDSRTLHVTNLATGQEMTFAANPLSDSITVSSGNDSENVAAAEVSVLPEHGPGWLAINPSGKFLYVVNHASESVSVFAIDWKTGALNAVVGSPVQAGAKPWSVEVDPDGAGLSVAHLEDTDISRFRIDAVTGALTPEQQ
jgi:Lactonase, 7-bladed beta-propeller/Bacterial Ig-like domain (group 2)